MVDYLLKSVTVAIVCILLKYFNMRMVEKKYKPFKELVKDMGITLVSSIVGIYIYDTLTPIVNNTKTEAFVGDPGF